MVMEESRSLSPGANTTLLWRPTSLEEAWYYKRRFGEASLYVAGGTWLRTRWEGGLTPAMPQHVISLEHVPFLRSLHIQKDGSLTIGASVKMGELLRLEGVHLSFPLIRQAAAHVAAPSVRNLATVGGNVMTGTGDLLPALLAHDAVLLVYDGRRTDRIPVGEWLQLPTRPSELLLAGIKLAPLPPGAKPFYHKLGRREQFTPSLLSVAGWFRTEAGMVADIRLAAGGGSMKPMRLKQSEKEAFQLSLERAAEAVYQSVELELTDYSDDYATGSYRKRTAANLIANELMPMEEAGGVCGAAE